MKTTTGIFLLLLLLLLLGRQAAAQQQSRFLIYGFFDLEFEMNTDKANDKGFFAVDNPKPSTFDVHHVNIMTDFQINNAEKVFIEIEWEHGPELEGGGGPGAVKLERAWFEHRFSPRFKARVGKLVPSFGLFNTIHDASPAYNFQVLPAVYDKHSIGGSGQKRMFAMMATGVQVEGAVSLGSELELGYSAYLVNGNGPAAHEADDDQDKGFGAKLGLGTLTGAEFSGSFYTEMNTFLGNRDRMLTTVLSARYPSGNLEVLGELELVTLGDFNAQNHYLELGYNLNSLVTPMVRFSFVDDDVDLGDNENTIYSIGTVLHLSANARLKLEDHVITRSAPGAATDQLFMCTIAVTF